MKKIFLHVGPHKTGTTFLQVVFAKNIARLAEDGIDYLDFGRLMYGHHEMAASLNSSGYEKGEISNAINASTKEKILLSSENFDVLTPKAIAFLKEELSQFSVEVLIYYRAPTSRLFSWWQEEVKHGETKTYSEYALQHYNKPYSSNVLNISQLVKLYVENFGKSSLVFFDYDYCVEKQCMLSCFEKYLGLTSELYVGDVAVNVGLSVLHIEMIRVLNDFASRKGTLQFHNIRDAYLKKWDKQDPLVTEIQAAQDLNGHDIFLGSSYIDKILKEVVLDEFHSNFYTNIATVFTEKKIRMPNSCWSLSTSMQSAVDQVYSRIMGE